MSKKIPNVQKIQIRDQDGPPSKKWTKWALKWESMKWSEINSNPKRKRQKMWKIYNEEMENLTEWDEVCQFDDLFWRWCFTYLIFLQISSAQKVRLSGHTFPDGMSHGVVVLIGEGVEGVGVVFVVLRLGRLDDLRHVFRRLRRVGFIGLALIIHLKVIPFTVLVARSHFIPLKKTISSNQSINQSI